MEIYNENVRDLLGVSGSKENLSMREASDGSFFIPNLTKHVVRKKAEITKLLNKVRSVVASVTPPRKHYESSGCSVVTDVLCY